MFKPDSLPLKLWYTTQSEMTGFHVHEFAEIAVVLSGSATYRTDFTSQRISRGDILCIPEGAGHAYGDEKNCELMNILFQFDRLPLYCRELAMLPGFSVLFTMQLPFYQKHGFYPIARLPEEDFNRFSDMLRWLFELQKSSISGYQLAVLGGFMQFITLLANNYSLPTTLEREVHLPEKINNVIRYMQLHFSEPLNVADLARRSGMSEASFFRHFKNATAQTPADFLIKLRLNLAAELLRTQPDITIAEVAIRCGFNECSYFARMFRRDFGVSPLKYRRSANLCDKSVSG
jgi:AraC-like DNA-binding protein